MNAFKGMFIGLLMSLPFWIGVGFAFSGGYFIPQVETKTETLTYKTVTDTQTVDEYDEKGEVIGTKQVPVYETREEEVESRRVTWEEVDLAKTQALWLDNICTWIEVEGLDPEGKAITYQRRVTLRKWIEMGKPKRVGPYSPYRVLLGHEPVMPTDKAINSYLETQSIESK